MLNNLSHLGNSSNSELLRYFKRNHSRKKSANTMIISRNNIPIIHLVFSRAIRIAALILLNYSLPKHIHFILRCNSPNELHNFSHLQEEHHLLLLQLKKPLLQEEMIRLGVKQLIYCSSTIVLLEKSKISILNELFHFTISNQCPHQNQQMLEPKHLKEIIQNHKELDCFIEISLITTTKTN